jgi:hypothetical protein
MIGALTVLHSYGRLLVLPANIRQGWKCMVVASTVTYYGMATITVIKSFIVQAPGHENV